MYNDPNQPQPPYGQPPNYQNPYEQGQGQSPFGQPPNYQNPYEQGQSPYGQPPYEQPQSFGEPPYSQPQPYAPTQYGTPPYAPPQVPNYAQPQKSSNRTLWIVLGIIGAILLLACGGCAVAFGILGRGVQQTVNTVSTSIEQTATAVEADGAQLVAQDYYLDIQSQDYAAAYANLDSGLQTTDGQTLTQNLYTSAAQAKDTSLGQVTSYTATADANDPSSITVTVTRSAGSTYQVHLKLTFTNGSWKISSYDNI